MKFRQIYQEYPYEFSATPAGDLQCNLCNALVKCDNKVCLWKATEKVSNTNKNWKRRANSEVSKPFHNIIKKTSRNRLSLHTELQTEPSFFKVSLCCNRKTIAFGDCSSGMYRKISIPKRTNSRITS